jgi:hypothetical protein
LRLDLGPALAAVKAEALARVDAEAEEARRAWITLGAGQAMEYMATEADARAYQAARAASAPADPIGSWPWLEAEQAARGGAMPLGDIADEVVANANGWTAAGAAIKALRRGRKLQIESAATITAVRAAFPIPWPAP